MDHTVESRSLYVGVSDVWSLSPAIVVFGALVVATSLFALGAAFTLGAPVPVALAVAIALADAAAGAGMMRRSERARSLFVGFGAVALALVAVAAIVLGGGEQRARPARAGVTSGAPGVRAQLSEARSAEGGEVAVVPSLARPESQASSAPSAALTVALLMMLVLVGAELWFFTRPPVVRIFVAKARGS
ncbi:MAG TPA: hypothetical protein VMA83_10455 [Solirubrobacteraceae bacterium]|nr:hypothetical protein [Solirubrobacteraceae bacterium]